MIDRDPPLSTSPRGKIVLPSWARSVRMLGLTALLIAGCGVDRRGRATYHPTDAETPPDMSAQVIRDFAVTSPDLTCSRPDSSSQCPCGYMLSDCTWCGCFRNDAGDQPPDVRDKWQQCLDGNEEARRFCAGLIPGVRQSEEPRTE